MTHDRLFTSRPPATCLLICLFASPLLISTGCSQQDDRRMQPTVPATVEVFHHGAPLKDCQVVLHPVAKEATPHRRALPNGHTDAQGKTQLTSYIANDGAAEGDYVVTLMCKPVIGEEDGEPKYGPDKFAGKYASSKTSPLRGTIQKDNPAPLRLNAE